MLSAVAMLNQARYSSFAQATLCATQMAFERGLAPDDDTLAQLVQERDSPFAGEPVARLRWPDEPLRSTLIRTSTSSPHKHAT